MNRALRSGAAGLCAFVLFLPAGYGADVSVESEHPVSFGQHVDASAAAGPGGWGVRVENPFGIAGTPTTNVFGNVTVNGDVVTNGGQFLLGDNRGPWGQDALRVDPDTGQVRIGNDMPWFTVSRLIAHTRIKSAAYRAFDFDAGLGDNVYAYGESFDNGAPGIPDELKRGQFGARRTNGTLTDISDDTFIPLRIEADQVHVGTTPPAAALDIAALGYAYWIGIGKDRDLTNAAEWNIPVEPPPDYLLEVEGRTYALGFSPYSSRQFKTDIVPLTRADEAALLGQLETLRVVRFRYRAEGAGAASRLGLIAEEAPADIVSERRDGLRSLDTLAFVAASIKELHRRNQELLERLRSLEEKEARLDALEAARR